MADPTEPTDEERRHAVCRALASGPGLIRFAGRYTDSVEDAEDAYQRALEVALTRAPVTEDRRFLSWLFAVLKHEALAVSRTRRREGPAPGEDVGESLAEAADVGPSPEGVAEWRMRLRGLQDALASLTQAQRICLMLQSAGASYQAICTITGYSRRKVERSVLEGRRSLHAWELRLAGGDVCDGLRDTIERVGAGEASRGEERKLGRHIRHCQACRADLRSRRQSHEWLGALVPGALLAHAAEQSIDADPTPMLAHWERAAGTVSFRLAQLAQLATDVYAAATTKIGLGAATVAIAGAAGAPLVVDAVKVDTQPPPAATGIDGSDRSGRATSPTAQREPPKVLRPEPALAMSGRDPRSGPRVPAETRAAKTTPAQGPAARREAAAVRTPAKVAATPPAVSVDVSSRPWPSPAVAPSGPSPAVALEFGP